MSASSTISSLASPAVDGSQAVTHGMSEAVDDDVIAEVRMKPLVQRIGC